MKPIYEARRAIALTTGFDIVTAFLAMLIAVEARWRLFGEFETRPFPDHIPLTAGLVFAIAAFVSLLLFGVYRQVWRHMGGPDVLRLIQAVGFAALVFLPLMFLLNRLDGFPRASLLLAIPVWLGLLLSGRMLALLRSTNRPFQLFRPRRSDAPRAILIGDQDALAAALRQMDRAPEGSPLRILSLLETSGEAQGRVIRGLKVQGGLENLADRLDLLKERYDTYPWVATVGDARSRKNTKHILAIASERGSKVMSIATGSEGAHLEKVRPVDLLGRRERQVELGPIQNLIGGARILITGAGGTIGAELTRQCAALDPEEITVLDSSEYNLYEINYTLSSRFPHIKVHAILADVRDADRLERIMRQTRPDIVIHAAALKHVPLMETNPCEAVLTNIGGAANAVRAAIACKAKRFVLISTDKAVDPNNVMGATKRISEMMVAELARDTPLAVSMVRFGNVLGSSGSVVPRFEEQIANNGPVTVTDKDITRFFMTVEEAVYLVLHAAAQQCLTGPPSLFVLDMGPPVRIQSLAENMIRMKGLVPGVDIKIVHTGLRPGDKMHETLAYAHEDLSDTAIDGISKVTAPFNKAVSIALAVESLLKTAQSRDSANMLPMLDRLVGPLTGKQDTDTAASIG